MSEPLRTSTAEHPKSPPPISAYTSEQQSLLTLVLDEYLTKLEAGERVDKEALIEQHPEIAALLRVQLDNLALLHEAADTPASAGSFAHYTAPKQLGDYDLDREIGRGGMGIVYAATDRTLNRQVALKVLPFAAVLDRKQIARFRNEAQAAAQLSHPNIVPVYSVGVDRGVHFYAMQHVDGRPLSSAIADLRERKQNYVARVGGISTTVHRSGRRGRGGDTAIYGSAQRAEAETARFEDSTAKAPISTYQYPVGREFFKHAAEIGIQVAEGLQHAHDFGIVHRDVKPSNLLLDETGKVWIADFGLAHIPSDVSMTAPGDVLGTVRYMSPEQAGGHGSFVDHRTDIYSLGVTLYELVAFHPAFSSNRRQRLLEELANEPPAPRKVNREIPVDLETIIMKAMAKEPSDRYASAKSLAADLRRFIEGRPTEARRPSLVERLAKWSRRHRRVVAAAIITLLLASAIWAIRLAAERNRTAAALAKSQTNFNAAREIVDKLGVSVSDDLAWVPGSREIRRQLLLDTQRFYNFFLTQTDDGSLRQDRSIALTKAALVADKLEQKRQALDLYAEARENLGVLIAESPDNFEFRRELARCLNNEGVILRRLGRSDEALARLDESHTRHQQLADEFGMKDVIDDLASVEANRAVVLEQRGEFESSRAAYEAAISSLRQMLANDPDNYDRAKRLSLCLHNLASSLERSDPETALTHCLEAIEIQERLLPTRHEIMSLHLRSDLALSYNNLGRLRAGRQQWDQAERSYRTAIAIEQRLSELAPSVGQFRRDLAISLNNLGQLQLHLNRPENALSAFQQSTELLESLTELAPDNVAYISSLGAVQFNQGIALVDLKRLDEAENLCRRGLANHQLAVTRAPREPQFQEKLVTQTEQFEKIFTSDHESSDVEPRRPATELSN